MKDFLFKKFLDFDKDSIHAFGSTIRDFLPSAAKDTIELDTEISIWGYLDDSFWWVSRSEGRLYEPNGTIHVISISKGQSFFNLCSELYNSSIAQGMSTISQPLEFDTLSMTVLNHLSGIPVSGNVYYSKFVTPSGSYGLPPHLAVFLDNENNDTLIQLLKDKITLTTWILSELKRLGSSQFPQPFGTESSLVTSKGTIVTVLPDFNLSATDCYNRNINVIEDTIPMLSDKASGQDLLNSAREQWTKLLIN